MGITSPTEFTTPVNKNTSRALLVFGTGALQDSHHYPRWHGRDTLTPRGVLAPGPTSLSPLVLRCFLGSFCEVCPCAGEQASRCSGPQAEDRLALIVCINFSGPQRCLLDDST